MSSLTPHSLSGLGHHDPHSVSNLHLPRSDNRLHGKANVKVYQSNANLVRHRAPEIPEDETLRSVEAQPNAYSTFGREAKMHPQQQLMIKHAGSMPALHHGASHLGSIGTTQRKETSAEEGDVYGSDARMP